MTKSYHLTATQESMLHHYILYPQSRQYFEQTCWMIEKDIDVSVFCKAWEYVYQQNDILNTEFEWENLPQPVQVTRLKPAAIKVMDISQFRDEKDKIFCNHLERDLQKINLRRCPFTVSLYIFSKTQYMMAITHHHILLDGWSNSILLQEFIQAYQSLYKNQPVLHNKKQPYKKYVQWVRNEKLSNTRQFWTDYLKGYRPPANHKKASVFGVEKRLEYELSQEEQACLQNTAALCNVSVAVLVYFLWAISLADEYKQNDVVIGAVFSQRPDFMQNTVGLFINTFPLRVQFCRHETIFDHLVKIRDAVCDLLCLKQADINIIYEAADCSSALFHTTAVIQNYPIDFRFMGSNQLIPLKLHSRSYMTGLRHSIGVRMFKTIIFDISYQKNDYSNTAIHEKLNQLQNYMHCLSLIAPNETRLDEFLMMCG